MSENTAFLLSLDLDGTLIDLEYAVSALTADLATQAGFRTTAEDVFIRYSGFAADHKFKGIAADNHRELTDDKCQELCIAHEEGKGLLYEADDMELIDGVPEALEELAAQGHTLCISSNNPVARSRNGLIKTGIIDFFDDRIFGQDNVGGLTKPHPALIQAAMKEIGFAPAYTIHADDTCAGVEGGINAGAITLGFADERLGETCQNRKDAYARLGAKSSFSHFTDLPQIVEEIRLSNNVLSTIYRKPNIQ